VPADDQAVTVWGGHPTYPVGPTIPWVPERLARPIDMASAAWMVTREETGTPAEAPTSQQARFHPIGWYPGQNRTDAFS
jgi:hypothetical protein